MILCIAERGRDLSLHGEARQPNAGLDDFIALERLGSKMLEAPLRLNRPSSRYYTLPGPPSKSTALLISSIYLLDRFEEMKLAAYIDLNKRHIPIAETFASGETYILN